MVLLFWVCTSFLCCPVSTKFSIVLSQNIGLYYLSLAFTLMEGGQVMPPEELLSHPTVPSRLKFDQCFCFVGIFH